MDPAARYQEILRRLAIIDESAVEQHAGLGLGAEGANVSEISIRANRAHSYTVDDPEGHRWYFSEPL